MAVPPAPNTLSILRQIRKLPRGEQARILEELRKNSNHSPMADVFTKQKRSEVMAAVHGRGNQSTEWRLRARLISSGISGWRVNASDVMGKPDFVFDTTRIAVFVDGCFWHGCRHCRNIPATNRKFWTGKIEADRKRDRQVTRTLKKSGWRVIRYWEHELKREPEKCIKIIGVALLLKPNAG